MDSNSSFGRPINLYGKPPGAAREATCVQHTPASSSVAASLNQRSPHLQTPVIAPSCHVNLQGFACKGETPHQTVGKALTLSVKMREASSSLHNGLMVNG